jgi:hypothetical protein
MMRFIESFHFIHFGRTGEMKQTKQCNAIKTKHSSCTFHIMILFWNDENVSQYITTEYGEHVSPTKAKFAFKFCLAMEKVLQCFPKSDFQIRGVL